MASPYSVSYYEGLKEDSLSSAANVVPILLNLFRTRTVVDVGCGSGTWAKTYMDAGCDVLGIDGSIVQPGQLLIPPERFLQRDLAQPLTLDRTFDLVNCLEVAEHLSPSRGPSFVADLCRMGDVVVFSAAVPGQGGTHHVNEQWPSYWIPLFERHGFEPLDCIRWQVWAHPGVAWWYIQNLFVFVRTIRLGDFPMARNRSREMPSDLVHPRAFMRAALPSEMSPRMLREVLRALPHFPRQILAHLRK